MEREVCRESKNQPVTWNTVMGHTQVGLPPSKRLMHCLAGLEGVGRLSGICKTQSFMGPDGNALGVSQFQLHYPNTSMSCDNTFGELYVYLSCSGSCPGSPCMLRPVQQDGCINIPSSQRVFTLTEDYRLTVVYKKQDSYLSDYFSCDNKNCIPYSQVCDLVNNCGDHSDETNCTNHFACSDPLQREYIPQTSVCDGISDCADQSDECGDQCSAYSRQLLRSYPLKLLSWTIGALAILLNCITICKSPRKLSGSRSLQGKLDKMLVLLVSVGDFLMGGYLIAISSVDYYYGGSYCEQRYSWLTSKYCAVLGVISTLASQVISFTR